MNKIRFSFFAAGAALAVVAGGLQAQTSIQAIHFTLFAEYQTNTFFTNTTNPEGPLTNENAVIRTVLIGTGNLVKALAVDLEGTAWTNWAGSTLVREVNMTNGNEGIFLRVAGRQTNVSSFFGGSFSNNFTGGLTTNFPGLTNFSGLTNTFVPQLQLDRGTLRMTDPTNTTTNFVRTAGLYFVSFNTTNIKFNMVAVGNGYGSNVIGGIDGTIYERPINWQYLGTAGSCYLNTTSNIFDTGDDPPVFFSGPIHGSFSTSQPWFRNIAGP